ncbi:MAG: cbb3-type cytochrome oxidase assembly protein [Bacteroidetes bacterium]|nr:cbb3-type cytochrome oxidase assembly protein [Bacteroidota bacterium]
MSVIIIIMLCSLLIALGFLVSFLITIKKGAMDDEYSESVKILFDNKTKSIKNMQS